MKSAIKEIDNHPKVRLTILLGFILALTAVASMSFFAYNNVKDLAFSLQIAINPDTFYNELGRLEKSLIKSNESVKNYAFTREPATLSSYELENDAILLKLKNLDRFTVGNTNQSEAIHVINDLILGLMNINDSIIYLGDEKGEVIKMFTDFTQDQIQELSKKDFKEESLISAVPEIKPRPQVQTKEEEVTETEDTSEETKKTKRNWISFRTKSRKKKIITEEPPVKLPEPDTIIIYDSITYKPKFNTEVIPAKEIEKLKATTDDKISEVAFRQSILTDSIIELTERGNLQMTRIRVEFEKLNKAKEIEKGNIVVDAGVLVDKTLFQLKVFGSVLIFVFALLLGVIYADMNHNHRLQAGLVKEKARAEKLGKAKEEFLANMSHEIRTPMNAVIGFAEQMAETPLTYDQRKFLNPIRNSAKYLLGLINDILDYSKIESGNFRLETIGFRPTQVIESVKDTFSHSAASKGISLICETQGDLPEVVKGDPLRVKQMLFNLVSNAIKFTLEGEVRLTVSAGDITSGQKILKFEVADTGVGIPQKSMDKIFMDFEQADNTTTRKYGGTGLGLSITKKLAEMMNGEIAVTSEEGIGTKVLLSIPFTQGTEADLVETITAKARQTGLLTGKKALIADDEPYNRLLIKTIMDKWGVLADVVENGKEVMFHLDRSPAYDFILMDLQMPEMDGFETSSNIRNQLRLQLPILALTATATPSEIQTIESNGMNGYLLKPFDQSELYGRLVSLLGLNGNDMSVESNKNQPEEPSFSPTGQNTYNLDQLFHLANQDKTFVVSMLNIFISNATSNLEKLTKGASAADWDTVSMSAHKMIPPSRHLGLDGIVEKLKAIELDTQSRSNLEKIPGDVESVSKEIEEVLVEIRKDVERLSS
ncbi:MAG: ATP-binding protein [Bacteroidia bacterium]